MPATHLGNDCSGFCGSTSITHEHDPNPAAAPRTLPALTPLNGFFWKAGRDGRLKILRCGACGAWLHPPGPVCPACLSRDLTPHAVSGRATIETYTINHQAWSPDLPVPYVVAIVSLEECPAVRLTTNIIHCAPMDLRIGDPVRVLFEQHGDVWLPLFVRT